MSRPIPLELSGDDVRALTEEALAYLVEFTERRRDAPSADFDGVDQLLERVRHPAPEELRAEPWVKLGDTATQGPRRLAPRRRTKL